MNHAIVLSGGKGLRLGNVIPKQYLLVNEKPIIMFCLETLNKADNIDDICIVAAKEWQNKIMVWIKKYNINKPVLFTEGGASRQESILNGLLKLNGTADDIVLIHDAARPLLTNTMINDCLDLRGFDGVMPVLPVKDTIYYSNDKRTISDLLNRDCLFAGQSPESFLYGKYKKINIECRNLDAIRGSSEIAFKNGMRIRITEGDENNYKITTIEDLKKFQSNFKG